MSPVGLHTSPAADTEVPQPPAVSEQLAPDTTLSEIWMTLRKRKYIVLAAALLGLLYGFYQSITQPRLYVAYGTIQIRSGASNAYRVNSTASFSEGNSTMPTQVAILKSDTLLLSVARALDLANNRAFMGALKLKGPLPHRNLDDPSTRQQVLSIMQGDVTVTALQKTDLIHISAQTLDAGLSADIVNRLIHEYIFRSLESSAEAQKRVSEFLSNQLDDLKKQVEVSQAHVFDLQKRLGIIGIDPTHNEISASLDDLTRALGQAQLARIGAETRYRTLTGMNPETIDESIDSQPSTQMQSELPNLRQQLDTAHASLAQLQPSLGPNHPQVKALQAQIAELTRQTRAEEQRILLKAKENYEASRKVEEQTRGALEAEKEQADRLRDDLIQYTLQQREFDSNRTLYEGLLQRLRTAAVEAGLESTEIDIVDNAVPPVSPSLRPRSTILLIDTLVALILGVILVFILDSLDTGLRTVAEIEAISGLPSLALIPRTKRIGAEAAPGTSTLARNIGVIAQPKSQFAESFRALRTSLLLSTAGREPKTILLTSATPSEGKTTVSINLACVLAQRDVRVLLIDADLRRPTVHHRFGLNGKIGLSSVLTGSITLEEAVQHVAEVPNLDVLVSGPVPPFPTEMLSSETMKQLLEHCKGLYTHVVIDSPPLLSVTDSVVLARDADAVVLIVRHGKSGKHAVRRARDLLLRSGAPITGIALNAVDLNSPEYYSYYGYYGYSGYASAGVDTKAWETKDSGNGTSRSKRRKKEGDAE